MNDIITADVLKELTASFICGICMVFLHAFILESMSVSYGIIFDKIAKDRYKDLIRKISPACLSSSRSPLPHKSKLVADIIVIVVTALIFPFISYYSLDGVLRLEACAFLLIGFIAAYKAARITWRVFYSRIMFIPHFFIVTAYYVIRSAF